MKNLTKEQLGNTLVYDLLKVSANLQKIGNTITKDYGINQQQFVVFNKIIIDKEINQKELTTSLLFEKSNVSKIVKKLSQLGYIKIKNNKDDSRVTLVYPTRKGINIWNKVTKEFEIWNAELVTPLKKAEMISFIEQLEKLNKIVSESD